jgi:hypothetical protein
LKAGAVRFLRAQMSESTEHEEGHTDLMRAALEGQIDKLAREKGFAEIVQILEPPGEGH